MHSVAYFFHENVTPFRCALAYVALITFLLGVTLPIIGVVKKTQKDNHVEAAQRIADILATELETHISYALTSCRLLRGFISSGAPLAAPPYFSNLTGMERVAVALRVGTPGSMNYDGYNRLLNRVAKTLPGMINVAAQPGMVSFFSSNTSVFAGADFLNTSDVPADTVQRYQNLIERGMSYMYLVPWGNNNSFAIVRAPVWTDADKVSRNASDVDADGHHVNWRYAWGAVSITVDLRMLFRTAKFASLVDKAYDYLFEALPHTALGYLSNYTVFATSAKDAAVFAGAPQTCVSRAGFESVCFRVRPKASWNGDDGTTILIISAIVIIFAPAILLISAITLIRIIVGPKPDALVEVPRQAPFHAVCIDMPKSNKMYVEVPFVLMEVTTTFNAEMERLCIRHDVHVAQRLGHTIIVVSAYRSRIVNFTLAMSEWCYTHKWPTHITLHNRHGCVDFSFIMHTCQTATITVDPAAGDINIAGPDVQALLLLRVAAVPRHVICTNQFLGIGKGARSFRDSDDMAGSMSAASGFDLDSVDLLQKVREIGVCHLRINSEKRPFITLQGFLVPSAATAKKASLADVTGAFPEWLLQEWHVSRADRQSTSSKGPYTNPLATAAAAVAPLPPPPPGPGPRLGRMEIMNVLDSIATARGQMPASIYSNAEASESLPASAMDIVETRRIAAMLVSMTQSSSRGSGSTAASPALFSADVQRLRQSLSLATYCFLAYRILLSPLDMENRLAIVNIWTSVLGLPSETFKYALAARCARVAEYLEFERLEAQRRLMRVEEEMI
jgi:hypothetical protein